MPINAYTGLMGSGKSFEAVRSVIIPAILAGRDVVTNVEGINSEAIRAYCQDKFNKSPDDLGHVRHCQNDDLDKPMFFPVPITDELGYSIEPWIPLPHFTYYARAFKSMRGKDLGKTGYQIMLRTLTELRDRGVDIGSALVQAAYKDAKDIDARDYLDCKPGEVFCDLPEVKETIVRPGDMVVIDEAWRFWGTQSKILAEHRVFFREHRHYVNPKTHVSCDLVLMVQDITDLHRTLKVVVEMSFRTTKLKSLGFTKTYRVEMWEGYKLTRSGRLGMEVKKYDPEIFPLYSSYTGGKGVEVQVDSRQNILNNKKLWFMVIGCIALFCVAVTLVLRFFDPASHGVKTSPTAASPAKASSKPATSNSRPSSPIPVSQSLQRPLSSFYRITGEANIGGEHLVVLASPSGPRYVPRSWFSGGGYQMTGIIDGLTVSYFSGPAAQSSVIPNPGDAQ